MSRKIHAQMSNEQVHEVALRFENSRAGIWLSFTYKLGITLVVSMVIALVFS